MLTGWQLKRIQGPDIEPVSLSAAKRHLRVDDDLTDDDPDILDWIAAAREAAENYMHRTVAESTWIYSGPSFPRELQPGTGRLELPMGPLLRMNRVSYIDRSTGARTDLDLTDPAQIQVSADDMPPWLYSQCWPASDGRVGSVEIEYVAGYPVIGSPATDVACPKLIKAAMRMLIGHWYTNRESVVAETRIAPAQVPMSFEYALDPLKVYP